MTPGPQSSLLPWTPGVAPALLIAALALAAWHGAYRLLGARSGRALARGLKTAARVAVGALALLLVTEASRGFVVFATGLPLWVLWVAGAGLVEGVLRLYRAERAGMPRPRALAVGGLRAVLAVLVVAMLAQPVFVRESRRRRRRGVVVLVDVSQSMGVPDTGLSTSEKVRMAEALSGAALGRPHRLEEVAERLDEVREELEVHARWLTMVGGAGGEALRDHLESRAAGLRAELADAADATRQCIQLLPAAPTDYKEGTQQALDELRVGLGERVLEPLKRAAAPSQEDASPSESHAALLESVRSAQAALAPLVPRLREAGRRLDEAFYAELPPEARTAVDRIARTSRLELARRVLMGNPAGRAETGGGLLSSLDGRYDVRIYAFASEPVQTAREKLRATEAPASGLGQALDARQRMTTDLRAALGRAHRNFPGESLAGVILLSDGRHNAAEEVLPTARQIAVAGAPICPVALGSRTPPRDAAVLSLDVPDAVHVEDRMLVTAGVKLDGLAGRKATVGLYDVESERMLVSEELTAPAEQHRRQVGLAYTPEETGLRHLRVAVDSFDGEVFPGNNEVPLRVNVTEERTRLLMIEGSPRWEFRYLKNLFADRDPSVKLQYVLFEPGSIAGMEELPEVHAAASRPDGKSQATALPAEEEEWMKFDVILLGDVAPAGLTAGHRRTLRRFVVDRGGTLVVIAGPYFMPRAFAGTALEELLPAELGAASAGSSDTSEPGFHVALTPEGLQDVVMRQKTGAEQNAELWHSFPVMRWRDGGLQAKAGATVLAYALPEGAEPPQSEEEEQELIALNPLILRHRVGMGRVLLLATDRTWRLRYRAGDTHHHKFWGQIMRWATASRLPAGTDLVKLGTDRSRYAPGEEIRVRARLLRPDLSPLTDAEAAVNVLRDDELVLRRRLSYVANSPGLYSARIGPLPPGTYELALESPQAETILAQEGASSVSTELAVDPTGSPEQAELAADYGLLGALAEETGGLLAKPARAGRVLGPLRGPVIVERERYEYVLWNSWPFLALMIGMAAAEWLVRKKGGLP